MVLLHHANGLRQSDAPRVPPARAAASSRRNGTRWSTTRRTHAHRLPADGVDLHPGARWYFDRGRVSALLLAAVWVRVRRHCPSRRDGRRAEGLAQAIDRGCRATRALARPTATERRCRRRAAARWRTRAATRKKARRRGRRRRRRGRPAEAAAGRWPTKCPDCGRRRPKAAEASAARRQARWAGRRRVTCSGASVSGCRRRRRRRRRGGGARSSVGRRFARGDGPREPPTGRPTPPATDGAAAGEASATTPTTEATTARRRRYRRRAAARARRRR